MVKVYVGGELSPLIISKIWRCGSLAAIALLAALTFLIGHPTEETTALPFLYKGLPFFPFLCQQ
ncbi:hypothetical protein [Okeania sp. KiyG1]|uniref:hypothetical protein n=1 Tax=Okeania sp. KiyG1 TaxID=2720165 RepID=UPI00192505E1|nr:hypothetical protein [Okeania sp. KiyG1]